MITLGKQTEGINGDKKVNELPLKFVFAIVGELVDPPDLESGVVRRVGSSPTFGTE